MGLLSDILSDDEGYGKLVYEGGGCRLWSNDQTASYEKQMQEYSPDGIAPVERFKVYLVEHTDSGAKEYVAYNSKGEPFMDWSDPYTFDFKMSLYRMDLKEDYDIVNMAKKRGKKKGRKKR